MLAEGVRGRRAVEPLSPETLDVAEEDVLAREE